MLKWEILDFHRLETEFLIPWISHLLGLFLPPLSVCPASYCSVNDPPANGGVINRTRLRPGSKLFYYCNRGYRLVGSSNATCRLHSNGLFQWDTPPPFCQGKYMSNPRLICMPLLKSGGFRMEAFVVGIPKMFFDGRKELTDPESFSDSENTEPQLSLPLAQSIG